MKRVFILLTVALLYVQQGHAQQKQIWTEDFDGALPPSGWTAPLISLSGSWQPNTIYYQPGSSTTNPQSYRGKVPGNPGDSIVLTTPVYDCSNYDYVFLRFSHICKVSPSDIARIEYSIHMGGSTGQWEVLPWDGYLGSATNYRSTGFNAASYPQWWGNDSTVFPAQSWWKEESFDLTGYAEKMQVQFRFVIKRGNITGTNASYGWLLDNFRLEASNNIISPPIVEFTGSYPKDTVYNTSPWTINAKVKTTTNAPLKHPWLKYTVIEPGKQALRDSTLMTHVGGDSLWKAAMGQYRVGTQFSYSITGRDTMGNEATVNSTYTIKYYCGDQIASVVNYPYTGNEQRVMLPAGVYQLECWGAHGWAVQNTNQGKGGYAKGTLTVAYLQPLYIYVGEGGQVPTSVSPNTWTFNGGGTGYPANNDYCGNGGGASDIRTIGGTWDNITGLSSRIIVAGGGGAGRNNPGGDGGGETGGNGSGGPTGGTQSSGGTNSSYASGLTAATLGKAMTWNGSSLSQSLLIGGGGGYYGGGSGYSTGSGGSGYIGGVTNASMRSGATNNPSGNNNGYIRITTIATFDNCSDYSAATSSIDMSDTVAVLPAKQFPVIATIKNIGVLDMDSARVSYSVNGSVPISKSWHFPVLPWDFSYQDTIGYYTPKVNGSDTIVAWVNFPNGQTDNISRDDTLTKVIYGAADMFVEFVDPPADTVYSTGTYEIKARVSSLSGTAVNQVSLQVAGTYGGITAHDTLTMNLDVSDNLWKTIVPKKRAGTDVVYSISLVDISGNTIPMSGSYYIKHVDCGIGGGDACPNYSAGTSSIDMPDTVMISPATQFPIIASIQNAGRLDIDSVIVSYSLNNAAPVSRNIYFNPALPWDFNYQDTAGYYIPKVNDFDTVVVWVSLPNGQTDNITRDDTLRKVVYGAADILLEFVNPPADTVYNTGPFEIQAKVSSLSGTSVSRVSLNVSCTYQNATVNEVSSMEWDAADSLWKTTIPQKRFNNHIVYSIDLTDVSGNTVLLSKSYYIKRSCEETDSGCDTNSVGLASIDSPEEVGMMAGNTIPVRVTLRNKGMADLDSCYLNWSLNGVLQPGTTVYKDSLPDDFTDTITIGSYIPGANRRDTIAAWVSMPNGHGDPVTNDDTLQISPFGCPFIFSGAYLIGTGGAFPTLAEALNAMRNCQVSGNVVLQLKGVDTTNVDLSNISDYMQRHTLTITSYDNNADSAVIKVSKGVGITLGNSNNIVIKAITVNAATAASASYGIRFMGACTNVVVRDCKLLSHTTTGTNTVAPVHKGSGTGVVDSIFIINNLLNGGYYGFYFYGGTSASKYGTNVVFDSNKVSNQYSHAVYACSTAFKSVSRNMLLSRESNISTSWYGMWIEYCNGNIVGNKIRQHSTSITQPTGISLQYYNYRDTSNPGLIANNEIILYAEGGYGGMHLDAATVAHIINNSIYIDGSGANRGMNIQGSSLTYLTVKNNNIVMKSSGAYPVRLTSSSYYRYYDFGYNNMYAPVYVGYAGSGRRDIPAWISTVGSGQNSTKVLPDFVDPAINLNLTHDIGLTCPVISSVPEDISGVARYNTTTMGAYGILPMNGNGILTAIIGLTDGINTGQTEDVNVVIHNGGSTAITLVNLGWSINDTLQGNADYPVSLQMGDSTIITVASITYPSKNVNIKVWINNLNNGVLPDEKPEDDTANLFVRVCPGGYGDTLTVGQGGMFPDIQAVYRALELCGISADITLAFMPGTYTDNLNLSDNSTLFGNHKLTITSSTGDASDVIIQPSWDAGIILNNTNNVSIEALTVDVGTNGTHGVYISGACSTVTIKGCTILGSLENTGYHLIIKEMPDDVMSGLCITNNVLDGGYYGIYLEGSMINHVGNVRIDSNLIQNQRNYGVYANAWVDFISLSYNTILSRDAGTLDWIWYGLCLKDSRGPVIGNKIKQRNTTTITASYGMYLENYNNTANGLDLVANNEIIVFSTGAYGGICVAASSNISLLHNSIQVGGTGAGRGIILPNSNVYMEVKNNNIIMKSPSSYPIYIEGTNYVSRWDIDYNNMYAPVYAGYAGGNKTDINTWQQTVTSDAHSVRVLPAFVDTTTMELLVNNDTLECPRVEILTDIREYSRPPLTTMGAYIPPPAGLDLMIRKLYLTEQKAVTNQAVSVSIDVWNTGSTVINNATFGWSVNGQVQPTTVSHTFTSPLGSYRQNNVHIGTFHASGNTGDIDVVVWVKTLNTVPDPVNWNDTATASAQLVPLAEFVAPFAGDTIHSLSFDVYATIFENTGAVLTPPKMYIETTMDGSGACYIHAYDTVDMVKENGKWLAHIPKQYYNSNVIYQLHVSDTVGNNLVLKDSTTIAFGSSIIDNGIDYPHTGGIQAVTLDEGTYLLEVWGANGGLGNYNSGTLSQDRIKGGTGGYSVGTITLDSTTTFYIAVGGRGADGLRNATSPGGYNGGGDGNTRGGHKGGSGGGATHIATATGLLSSLDKNRLAVMIVAGGGGGGGDQSIGGDGGGMNGIQPASNTQYMSRSAGAGGTQNAIGACHNSDFGTGFGQGGMTQNYYSGGGGGGWYGGCTGETFTGGGGGSGYIGGVINGTSADASQAGFVANPDTSGNGYVRITKFGYEQYEVSNNLAIYDLLSPVNTESEVCMDAHKPVKIRLSNLGENDYDFTKDSITIGYEITDSRRTTYKGNLTLNTGELLSGASKVIELIPAMPVYAGKYTIKAWVTSVLDNFICDDTLACTYTSGKVGLPVDEDFSNAALPAEFVSLPIIGGHIWEHCPDTNSRVKAVYGAGMLRYGGTHGSMARLSTRQLDLFGAVNPRLIFWYYHDTAASALDDSYTNVNVVADGNSTTALSLLRKGSVNGWNQYLVDLSPYTGNQCVFIQFESMNGMDAQSVQYIDRILITSNQDLEVSDVIITPNITACSLKHKELKIVLSTTMNQAIDLSLYSSSLVVDVPGYPTFDHPLQGIMRGSSSDTILISSGIDLVPGTGNIRAYLTVPVDNNPWNDTANIPLDIRPAISVTAKPISGGTTDCLAKGDPVQQKVTVKNTGNLAIPGIELRLNVMASSQQTLTKSAGSLNPGDSTDILFDGYIIPADAQYQVQITGYMGCDSALVNSSTSVTECVDMDDLALTRFVKPQQGETDTVGRSNEIAVYLKNLSDVKDYTDIIINALIEVNGNEVVSYREIVSKIGVLDSILYVFDAEYTVPDATEYAISVFINSKDNYPVNDTLLLKREAVDGDVGIRVDKSGIFTLKQNIPNPANNNTIIEYIIPQSGEVAFRIHSLNGQLLYNKAVQSEGGTNTIEVNTSTLVTGIYMYSMEYKGQRIVKRMSIIR